MAADCRVACKGSGSVSWRTRINGVLQTVKDECRLCPLLGETPVRMEGRKKKIALPVRRPRLSMIIVDPTFVQ